MEVVTGTPRPRIAASSPPPSSNDPVPAVARAKLSALQGAANDARDAANSAQVRLNDLTDQLNYFDGKPEEAGGIEHEMSRLQAIRTTQNVKRNELDNLCGNIRNWLRMLPRSTPLVVLKAPAPKLSKDETPAQAIETVREKIVAAKQDYRLVATAPLPKADLKKLAKTQVAQWAQTARPRLSGNLTDLTNIFGPATAFGPTSINGVVALLCWMQPDAMVAALEREIEAMPKPELALTAEQKSKRLAELKANIDSLERSEEALIEVAERDGLEILRRADASPAAVLGVALTAAKTARIKVA